MTDSLPNAGYHKLNYMRIKPLYETKRANANQPDYIDVTRVITNWFIEESIDSPFVSGYVVIAESDNLLDI